MTPARWEQARAVLRRISTARWPLVALQIVDGEIRLVTRAELVRELLVLGPDLQKAIKLAPPRPRRVLVWQVTELGAELVEIDAHKTGAVRTLYSNFERATA